MKDEILTGKYFPRQLKNIISLYFISFFLRTARDAKRKWKRKKVERKNNNLDACNTKIKKELN